MTSRELVELRKWSLELAAEVAEIESVVFYKEVLGGIKPMSLLDIAECYFNYALSEAGKD